MDRKKIWECHDCHEGVVIPGTYQNIDGQTVKMVSGYRDSNTEVMRFWSVFLPRETFVSVSPRPWFQHGSTPGRQHKSSAAKSYILSMHYRNSVTCGHPSGQADFLCPGKRTIAHAPGFRVLLLAVGFLDSRSVDN